MAPDPGLLITLMQKPEVLQRSVLGCNMALSRTLSPLSKGIVWSHAVIWEVHWATALQRFSFLLSYFSPISLPELMASIVFVSGRFLEALNRFYQFEIFLCYFLYPFFFPMSPFSLSNMETKMQIENQKMSRCSVGGGRAVAHISSL